MSKEPKNRTWKTKDCGFISFYHNFDHDLTYQSPFLRIPCNKAISQSRTKHAVEIWTGYLLILKLTFYPTMLLSLPGGWSVSLEKFVSCSVLPWGRGLLGETGSRRKLWENTVLYWMVLKKIKKYMPKWTQKNLNLVPLTLNFFLTLYPCLGSFKDTSEPILGYILLFWAIFFYFLGIFFYFYFFPSISFSIFS